AAAATTIQTSITANEAKISAYQKLQTLLSSLTSDTASLSKSIVNSLSSSAYGARTATISSTGDVSASSAVSMAIRNGAATGDHTLTVTQIATAHKVIGTSVADKTADMNLTGTFSIGLEGGTSGDTFSLLQNTPTGSTVNISIEVDTSSIQTVLEQFVTSYNAVRDYVTSQQTLTSDGTADSSSVLFGDGTMRNIMTQMEQALNS